MLVVVGDGQRLAGRIRHPAAAGGAGHRHRGVRRVHVVVGRGDGHRAGRGWSLPAAMVSRLLVLSVKAPVPLALVAATSTVTAALDLPDRLAVTVVDPAVLADRAVRTAPGSPSACRRRR